MMKKFLLAVCLLVTEKITFSQLLPGSLAPRVNFDGTIEFRLRASAAGSVYLLFDGKIKLMEKGKAGVWRFTTEPMPADIYEYNYIVDSLRITDPDNPLMKPSWKGGGESLVLVPGNPSQPWEPKDVPHGAVARQLYTSAVVGDLRDYYVYTPPGYDPKRKEPYPVLYLLHGIGDDARAWTQAGFANIILDNLLAAGKIEPMIMVNTLGYGNAQSMISLDGFDRFVGTLIKEIIPSVEKNYNASSDRNQRAIAGLSMGGAEALLAGLNHPDLFAWVGGFSSAFVMYGIAGMNGRSGSQNQASGVDQSSYARTFPQLDSTVNGQLRLLWISCGDADFLRHSNKDFMEWLSSKNIRYKQIETAGAHTWSVWRRNLVEFAPLLFR